MKRAAASVEKVNNNGKEEDEAQGDDGKDVRSS
jgi:hypothetical protein